MRRDKKRISLPFKGRAGVGWVLADETA